MPQQDPATRACQHLLLQGFTLYTCASAVCTRILAQSLMDRPEHAWAVTFAPGDQGWTAMLPESDPLLPAFSGAAIRAMSGRLVLCHTQGGLLELPLEPASVRDARMRIEAAVALGKTPPAERLEAFSKEMLELELARRRKRLSSEETGAPPEPRE